MKTRLLLVPLLLVLVASLAACGGGTKAVPANAVALVGSVPITTVDFNAYFKQALLLTAQQTGGTKPKPGTPQYIATRNQVVAYLVQINELEPQAPKEDVSVTDAEVTKYIEKLAKTSFDGDMEKLKAALKKQGLTMDTARQQVYVNLLAQKIHDKVTADVSVTTAQEKAYYELNISQYTTAASKTRSVEHILVKKKSLADTIEQRLKNGTSFAALAKKYSEDPGSAAQGGKYTATEGNEVAAYDDVAFALKTGELSAPVDATSAANRNYGWFIIKALGPVKETKEHTTPFNDVQGQIKQALSQQEVDKLWSQWLSDLKQSFDGKVSYQAGYAPPATTALPTTN